MTWNDALLAPDEITFAAVWSPPPGDLARFPHLRATLSLAAGAEHITRDPDWPRHVPLVRMGSDETVQLMSDYVVWACLSLIRGGRDWALAQTERRWYHGASRQLPADTTVGVAGLGNLGLPAAQSLQRFGFKVRGWSRSNKSTEPIVSYEGAGQFIQFLDGLDILVCLLPATRETRGILNTATFAHLAPGAGVINAGRGDQMIEADLVSALDTDQLAGAILDVVSTEPLPATSPLWGHPKITITPHAAATASTAAQARYLAAVVKTIKQGGTPDLLYDPQRGY